MTKYEKMKGSIMALVIIAGTVVGIINYILK